MLDVQMRSELFYQDKFLISQITPVFSLMRDLFLPSVYDAFLVLRPACHFRDARVLSHSTAHLREYFRELPFHESYFLGLIHLLPVNYSSRFQSFFFSISQEVCEFFFMKSYASWLVAELSQLCYKGLLRRMALGSTDGLCTWRVSFLMCFQPILVPVGRIALGRIFNVLGSSIDPYMHLSLACEFHSWHPIDLGAYVESGKSLSSYQAREFPAHDISFQKKHESYKFWFHFSCPLSSAWILAVTRFKSCGLFLP